MLERCNSLQLHFFKPQLHFLNYNCTFLKWPRHTLHVSSLDLQNRWRRICYANPFCLSKTKIQGQGQMVCGRVFLFYLDVISMSFLELRNRLFFRSWLQVWADSRFSLPISHGYTLQTYLLTHAYAAVVIFSFPPFRWERVSHAVA
jgi:hypothetical protein